jgi:putative oxygen-independent coproporphyrinogen III oxidase
LHASYVDACRREIVGASLPSATSVFFGGGTPSLLEPSFLTSILREVALADDAEVTVECNPDTVTPAMLESYAGAGVNRLSFGVQSMVPSVLASLGRTHRPSNVVASITMARAVGFDNWNVDLIYGAAGESDDDWRRTVESVLSFDPPHVSAYALTVEAGTPLAADPSRAPDDDDQAAKYLTADGLFAAAGLASYEISNWARPGFECRHNRLYWEQGDYRGIGCAAHSHATGRRWWNVRTPERYVAAIESGSSPIAASETLDAEEQRIEGLQLQLRTRDGVPIEALDADDVDLRALEGLLEPVESSSRIRLTAAGRLLANEVAIRLR